VVKLGSSLALAACTCMCTAPFPPSLDRTGRTAGRRAQRLAGGVGRTLSRPWTHTQRRQSCMHAPLLRTASVTVLPPHCAFELWRRGRSSMHVLCFASNAVLILLVQRLFVPVAATVYPSNFLWVAAMHDWGSGECGDLLPAFRGRRWVLACPQAARPSTYTNMANRDLLVRLPPPQPRTWLFGALQPATAAAVG
jgi:hypothetical protein